MFLTASALDAHVVRATKDLYQLWWCLSYVVRATHYSLVAVASGMHRAWANNVAACLEIDARVAVVLLHQGHALWHQHIQVLATVTPAALYDEPCPSNGRHVLQQTGVALVAAVAWVHIDDHQLVADQHAIATV